MTGRREINGKMKMTKKKRDREKVIKKENDGKRKSKRPRSQGEKLNVVFDTETRSTTKRHERALSSWSQTTGVEL